MDMICRGCGGRQLEESINLGLQPVAHRLLLSAEEPDQIIHPLVLHQCESCGLIQICDPIPPEKLYLDYNYCFSSWKPQPHLTAEIQWLNAHVNSGPVVEIGSNDGLFLKALGDEGFSGVMGIEPNAEAVRMARDNGITTYQGMLTEALCRDLLEEHGPFRLVVARQVIEHLGDLDLFFRCVRLLLADDGMLFIDFPDIDNALTMGDCSFIWEEHMNYFTEPSMLNLLSCHGFQMKQLERYNFSGGALAILAQKGQSGKSAPLPFKPGKSGTIYRDKINEYKKQLKARLEHLGTSGREIILYGVGCRACTLVNGLGLGSFIDYAVDDQVEKQNLYLPGNRLPIRSLDFALTDERPKVFLMAVNNENEDKVAAKIRAAHETHKLNGNKPLIVSLFSPKDIWDELEKLRV